MTITDSLIPLITTYPTSEDARTRDAPDAALRERLAVLEARVRRLEMAVESQREEGKS